MMKAKTVIRKVETTEISVRREDTAWGIARFDESGFVSIESNFGNWTYRFDNTSSDSMARFLVDLKSVYASSKFTGRVTSAWNLFWDGIWEPFIVPRLKKLHREDEFELDARPNWRREDE